MNKTRLLQQQFLLAALALGLMVQQAVFSYADDAEEIDPATNPYAAAVGAAGESRGDGLNENQNDASTEAAAVTKSMIKFLGKFHLLFLHFPIALVLIALLAEILGLIVKRSLFFDSARFMVLVAALSVVATVSLGWMAAAYLDYAGDYARMLWLHRWSGSITGGIVLFTAFCSELSHFLREGKTARTIYRIALVTSAAGIALTGHVGALMVHGINYFSR